MSLAQASQKKCNSKTKLISWSFIILQIHSGRRWRACPQSGALRFSERNGSWRQLCNFLVNFLNLSTQLSSSWSSFSTTLMLTDSLFCLKQPEMPESFWGQLPPVSWLPGVSWLPFSIGCRTQRAPGNNGPWAPLCLLPGAEPATRGRKQVPVVS